MATQKLRLWQAQLRQLDLDDSISNTPSVFNRFKWLEQSKLREKVKVGRYANSSVCNGENNRRFISAW
jgi:hypothetical protein